MKKLLLAIGIIFLAGTAHADIGFNNLPEIPAMKQGIAYSISDSKINYLTTFDIYNIAGVNLEAGYAGVAENTGDKFVAVISYDLFNAKEAGVKIPVLDLIEFRPGIYAGIGRVNLESPVSGGGNNEFDWGISASFVDVKF